ncbi:MAG TPA: GIY-YIG nuclease family protein [Bacillota bacterium]|nr:GIY-YIG nuclease family protein [Bacillota bacterium]
MIHPQILKVNHAAPEAAADVPTLPGTYALILEAKESGIIGIGKLGPLAIEPGFYVYTGSAFGPGGLRARLRHHLNPDSKIHWHIDYLRRATEIVEIRYWVGPKRLEHKVAKTFRAIPGAVVPLARFGASDCKCEAHLVYYKGKPHDRISFPL